MKDNFKDYFIILEVHYLASPDVIKVAYRKLCQIYHPDAGGEKEQFHLLQIAYETLIDPEKRKKYVKEWMKHYVYQSGFEFGEIKESLYDITLFHIKQVLIQYLDFIKNQNYIKAYELLSIRNKTKIYLDDYIVWQKLVSEIHHLLEFDCVLDEITPRENETSIHAIYKVKVKELNKLLNVVEEDYFSRTLSFENNKWCILLNDIDVRTIIRKYKKILAINKKNSKILKKYSHKIEENHFTKLVSKKYFINNCEYELLRFIRYNNPFTIIGICSLEKKAMDLLEVIIKNETRALDCFSQFTNSQYNILLPESKGEHGLRVIEKVVSKLPKELIDSIKFDVIESSSDNQSIKEMLDYLKRKIGEKY